MRQKSVSIADLGRTSRVNRGTLFAVQQQGNIEQLATSVYGAVGAVLDESPRIRSATIVTSLDADVADVVSIGANRRFNLVSAQTLAADLGTITAIVGDNATFTSVVQSPEFDVLDEGAVYFYEADANGAHRVGLKAASSLAASYTLTLPTTDGTSGQVMRTNGAGILSWMTPGDVVGPGSATDNAFALFDGTTGKLLKDSAVSATFTGTGSIVRATSPTLTTPTMSSPTISDRIIKVAGGDVVIPNTAGTFCLVGASQALTDKTLNDSSVTFVDNVDSTKALRFECSGISTATTRTLTVPNASGTIALTSDLAAYQPLDADLTSWAGVTRAAGFDTFAATPSSANLAALLSDETGTGAAVFATSPTLVTPNIGAATGTSLFLGGTPASGVLAYVNADANTATASALLPLAQVRNILNPAASSASIDYCYYATLRSDASCAQNFTAARAAYRSACEHLGSGTMEGLQGAHFWASTGPNSGASSGSGIVTNLYGLLADAWVNSTSSGTTTRTAAAQFSARNLSPGTVTTLIGNNVAVGSANGGSGAGTITQAYGLRVSGLDVTGADILTAGTITNGTMLEVGDWSSGPTYTNPPIGLNIASQTAANAIALKTGTGKIDLGDKITTYNNVATVGNGVPSIVAQASATAQSAAVGTTTLYTPPADGFYRVSAYLQLTTPATSSSTLGTCTITYTDGYGSVAQTNTMGFFNGSGGVVTSGSGNTTGVKLMGSMVIYAKSGVAITFAIAYASSGATAMQYAYGFKLEVL